MVDDNHFEVTIPWRHVNLSSEHFATLDAWCTYKHEKAIMEEKIELLELKLEECKTKARKDTVLSWYIAAAVCNFISFLISMHNDSPLSTTLAAISTACWIASIIIRAFRNN